MIEKPDAHPTQIQTQKLHTQKPVGRVALVWRGDPKAEPPTPSATRFHLIFSALAAVGLASEPVLYSEEAEDQVRARLLAVDGVLVWVNPLDASKDRSRLDPLLRDVAAHGVWGSTHPDVILKMGVKEGLYRTRTLSWSADIDLYSAFDDFNRRFPMSLAARGPRVLKQNRGNAGQGVWKVALATDAGPNPGPGAPIRILEAQSGNVPADVQLGAF